MLLLYVLLLYVCVCVCVCVCYYRKRVAFVSNDTESVRDVYGAVTHAERNP